MQFSIFLSLFPQYCTTAGPTSTFDSNLESLDITGENASSISYTGCPGLTGIEDQTASIVELSAGVSYTITASFGSCGGYYPGAGEIWIDYDGSETFDPSESIGTWSGPTPSGVQSYSFTVPPAAVADTHRMRVIQAEGGTLPLDPCASFSWGSAVDFSVVISAGTNCNGIPSAGTTSGDSTTCDAFTVSNTGATSAGIVYQWQSSLIKRLGQILLVPILLVILATKQRQPIIGL